MGLLALVLLVAVGAPACSRGKPSANTLPSPTPAAGAKVGFRATAVQAVDSNNRPQANDKANQVAAQVVDLVNAYYGVAFVDPAKWVNGQHTGLPDLFTADSRGQVGAQLQGLALGDLAPKIASVKPDKEEVQVKVYVSGDDLSAPVVSVSTVFEATAVTKTKADGPVKISHKLMALLIPDAGGYKIAGGTAELRADTAAGALGPIDREASLGSRQ
jgi:hypothetical protein